MAAPDASAEVPIFLRKLYAMINEVDSGICEWHDDGKSFVIKNQKAFEKSVIPQYFKHSKIASFVRQLNFYSFRKVPHHESLRIDPELEKRTKDWWRFRHESFQRDRPELLQHIKRTPNPAKSVAHAAATSSAAARPGAAAPGAAAVATPASSPRTGADGPAASSEVHQLKQKIAEMNRNIDELTRMVQLVSLKQEESDKVGQKRPKPGVDQPEKDDSGPRPDVMMSNSELDDEVVSMDMMIGIAPDLDPLSLPEPVAIADSSPASSEGISEGGFVDSLFDAFAQEPDVDFLSDLTLPAAAPEASSSGNGTQKRPDPELMRRLGDALMLLPREIQEMIVNRLIAAIMNTDIVTNKTAVSAIEKEACKLEETVPVTEDKIDGGKENRPESNLPLAAATLAALLHHYSSEVAAKSHQKHKYIPVIPVHG